MWNNAEFLKITTGYFDFEGTLCKKVERESSCLDFNISFVLLNFVECQCPQW